MAWTYLAESVDSHWPWHPGSGQSPTVKSIAIAKLCFCAGCETVCFLELLSGTTSPRSYLSCCPERRGGGASTSFTADSPARTSALRAFERGWKVSALGYSLRLSGSFAIFDRASFSWRTCQPSLFEGWTASPSSFPRSGMTHDGTCYALAMWERRTIENDSGFYPTPLAMDYRGPGLSRQRLARSRDNRSLPLSTAFKIRHGYRLPASFVEYLMGYAPRHTVLEPWAMQWFRSVRGKPSAASRDSKETA